MYLAPLNYDLFFKKVFSHLHIAKAFLEDFLETEVEEIKFAQTNHLLVDESQKGVFSFRCKINDKPIIVDIQQWYKTDDIIKRFYLYHCASTVLQLEYFKSRRMIANKLDTITRDHDYRQVVPVLTLIWMVSDQLEFEDNFVSFVSAPEEALTFLQDDNLWDEASKVTLLKKRRKVLKLLNNNHKELDFLKQNRLVFMFQRNIVKSMNTVARYYPWFEFASKTLNKDNDESDFDAFNDSKVFRDIMGMIVNDKLSASEKDYIETEDETNEMYQRYWDGVRWTVQNYKKNTLKKDNFAAAKPHKINPQ
jgi:hypothetical protein